MRDAIAASLLLLGGCAATSATGTAGQCDAAAVRSLIGESLSDALRHRAQALAGAASVRAIRPGEIVTMDYRGDRLTLTLGANGRVTAARCG